MARRGRPSMFTVYDRLQFSGRLAVMLAGWRGQGLSYVEISRVLANEHEIVVDPSTVGAWCRRPATAAAIDVERGRVDGARAAS